LDAPQPNIIVILVDDLGKRDISLYGGELIQTPNIDALGAAGVTFNQGYVTSPICSPSRAGLLTGRYQQRFGYGAQKHEFYQKNKMQYYGFKWFVERYPWMLIDRDSVPGQQSIDRQGIVPEEITLAELLKKYGYATACIGKWHVGEAAGQRPMDQGFDRFYGFYASHSLFAPEGSEGIVDQKIKKDLTDKYIWKGQREGVHAIYDQDQVIEEPEYLTFRIAEESIEFIKENKNNPFFLYAAFNAPHTPLQAPVEYVNKLGHIEDPVKRVYNAMILALDDAVGDMLSALEEEGLMDNTVIFFLSDNGGALYTYTTDNGPLEGGKITGFEGDLNVPFTMRWDGMIDAGTVIDEPVISLDIFATAAELAGAEPHPDYLPDGENLMLITSGDWGKPLHESLYWVFGWNKIIRQGDWKLMLDTDHGYIDLYNLKEDPYEKHNLADTYPGRVEAMLRDLNDFQVELPEPMWPPIMRYMHEKDGQMYYFAD
jgi:arylsulfatase A-like enzyme